MSVKDKRMSVNDLFSGVFHNAQFSDSCGVVISHDTIRGTMSNSCHRSHDALSDVFIDFGGDAPDSVVCILSANGLGQDYVDGIVNMVDFLGLMDNDHQAKVIMNANCMVINGS